MRTIEIQPKERKDMTLPYPYFIEVKHGAVGRQDFWKGAPKKLIGFNSKSISSYDPKGIDLRDFTKEPKRAIGMYPIFEHKDGKWHTYKDPIESVRVIIK